MYGFARMKRVTDPLDDKVKARIIGRDRTEPGYVSSGSEHSAQADDGVMPSSSLSDLFFNFDVVDNDETSSSRENDDESDYERDPSINDSNFANVDSIEQILQGDCTDEFQILLNAHVLRALTVFNCVEKSDREVTRRSVMAFLRDNYGYNAAICKTKWRSCGGLTGGSYEFIDVLRSGNSARYIVDLDFAAEFEIARPTNSYERLFRCLPKVFVGKIEELKRILRAASDGARRSLKSGGLILPPWRKHRYMQNKWLGSYRRTTNAVYTSSFSNQSPANQNYAVQCRAVGFDSAVNGGGLLLPVTARTR